MEYGSIVDQVITVLVEMEMGALEFSPCPCLTTGGEGVAWSSQSASAELRVDVAMQPNNICL